MLLFSYKRETQREKEREKITGASLPTSNTKAQVNLWF